MKILILAYLFSTAHANTKPTVVFEPGKIVRAVWSDGREAQVKINIKDNLIAPTVFEVTENLCSPMAGTGQKVAVHFAVRYESLYWVWTKHPEAQKVGQMLIYAGRPDRPYMTDTFVTNGTVLKNSALARNLPRDEIVFDTFSWLPGQSGDSLRSFELDSWMSEFMVPNSQTGVNENRIIGSVSGLEMKVSASNRVTIANMRSGFTMTEIDEAFMMVGDVVSWVFNENNRPCVISFKPDLERLISVIQKYALTPGGDTHYYQAFEDAHSPNKYFFEVSVDVE